MFWLLVMNPMVLFHRPEGLIKVMQVFLIITHFLQYMGNIPLYTHPYLDCRVLSEGRKMSPNVQSLKSAVFSKAYPRGISEMVCLSGLGMFIQYFVK